MSVHVLFLFKKDKIDIRNVGYFSVIAFKMWINFFFLWVLIFPFYVEVSVFVWVDDFFFGFRVDFK